MRDTAELSLLLRRRRMHIPPMTKTQRIIATMGVALMFGRFLSAPYLFEGQDATHRVRTGEERVVRGRVHAPFWAPPSGDDLVERARIRLRNPELQLEAVQVSLDATRLIAWLLVIALLTILAIGAPAARSRGTGATLE